MSSNVLKASVPVAKGRLSPRARGRLTLLLVWLVTVIPIVAAAVAYFYVRPEARSNYGSLIEPQRPLPALRLMTLDGRPFDLRELQTKWVLLQVDGGACDAHCLRKLHYQRQVRLSTGKDMERLVRVWLISDAEPVSTQLIREHDGALFLRADPQELHRFLAVGQEVERLSDAIWVIDPLGHLMMRFPRDFDPAKMRKDVSKLLYASRGWNAR